MRRLLILPLLAATPAAACDMDGMFGFNHYAQMAEDAAAAAAMRDAAIAEARDKFMARHGIAESADLAGGDADNSEAAGVAVAVNSIVDGTPR